MVPWLGFGLAFLSALIGVAVFFVRLVRAIEKRVDQLEQTMYDPMGLNGMVRKVKVLEDITDDLDLRFEQTERKMAFATEEAIHKVIAALERIYRRKDT